MLDNYAQINDYELLYMLHQKDDQAYFYLLNKYEGLMWSLVNQFWNERIPLLEREDFFSVACSKLFEAVNMYNEAKMASFYTYFILCVKRRFTTLIRSAEREKQGLGYNLLSLDSFVSEKKDTCYVDLIRNNQLIYEPNYYIRYNELKDCLAQFIGQLTVEERKIWDCHNHYHYTYSEAAKILKITRKQYGNRLYFLRRRLAEYLKEKGCLTK